MNLRTMKRSVRAAQGMARGTNPQPKGTTGKLKGAARSMSSREQAQYRGQARAAKLEAAKAKAA